MDTRKITNEILATGLTQQELADLVPCGQSTIAAFVNGTRGTNPTYVIATRLLAIHGERCGDPAARRATGPAPAAGHAGRQPPTTTNILDTVPDHAAVVTPGENA